MKRKLAEHDNLKIIIEQTGDKFHIKESSTFRTKDIDFTLGVPFDYSLADGTEVSVSALKRFMTWLNQQQLVQVFYIFSATGNGLENMFLKIDGLSTDGKTQTKPTQMLKAI